MAIEEEDLEALEKKEPVKEKPLSEEEAEKEAYPEKEEPIPEVPEEETEPEEPEPIPAGGMDLKRASEAAKKKLAEALEKPANATVSVERQGENWVAMVEILDEEYLPGQNMRSMSDIIGLYEVTLDNNGELLKFTRKNSYKRGEMQK